MNTRVDCIIWPVKWTIQLSGLDYTYVSLPFISGHCLPTRKAVNYVFPNSCHVSFAFCQSTAIFFPTDVRKIVPDAAGGVLDAAPGIPRFRSSADRDSFCDFILAGSRDQHRHLVLPARPSVRQVRRFRFRAHCHGERSNMISFLVISIVFNRLIIHIFDTITALGLNTNCRKKQNIFFFVFLCHFYLDLRPLS